MTDSLFDNFNFQRDEASPGSTAHTARNEQRLLEYLDGQASINERRKIEAHLASCAPCETLATQWRRLDDQLQTNLKIPELSEGFAQRVLRAIENVELQPVQSLKSIEAEWAAAWAKYRRRFLWTHLPAALDKIGFTLGAGLLVLILGRAALKFSNLATTFSAAFTQPWIMPAAIALSVTTLLAVLGFTARRPLTRFFASL
jgi:anti-sigma factor RsiW